MKKISYLALLTLLIAFIFGCAENRAEDFLFYQAHAMEINADFCIGPANYSGKISLGESLDGTLSDRDMSVAFTSPSSLSGIAAGRRDGQEYITYGSCNIEANTGEFLNMLDVCRLFSIERAQAQATNQLELDGVTYKFVRLDNSYGTYNIYLSNETGLPRRIEAKMASTQITVDINEIKIAEQNG